VREPHVAASSSGIIAGLTHEDMIYFFILQTRSWRLGHADLLEKEMPQGKCSQVCPANEVVLGGSLPCPYFFFFFWWYWSLNSGPHVC
jgi:hypothetical protein